MLEQTIKCKQNSPKAPVEETIGLGRNVIMEATFEMHWYGSECLYKATYKSKTVIPISK
jgi:hypothetical protein